MAYGALCFRDYSLRSDYYSSRSVADSSTGGSASGSYPTSNLFTRPIGQVYQRQSVNQALGHFCQLDFVCVPKSPEWGIGALGLLNVAAIGPSGGYEELKVRCRIYSTTVGVGSPLFDQTRLLRSPSFTQVPSVHAVFVPYPMSSTATYAHSGGLPALGNAIRFTLTAKDPSTTYTFSVGKFVAMQALPFKNNPRRGLGGYDPSDRQRSYGGQPYVSQRPPLSELSISGQLLSDEQVFGGTVADPTLTYAAYTSHVRAVNSVSGSSEPVLYVPDTTLTANGNFSATLLDTRADDKMAFEAFYGLLNSPIEVREENRTTGSTTTVGGRSVWRLSATLQEIPP